MLDCCWLVEQIHSGSRDSDCHVRRTSEAQSFTGYELSLVESLLLYAAPNSLFSHNGAGLWLTHAGKSWVFSRRLKVLSDSLGMHSEGGRLFQVPGPNTVKLRWPVEVQNLGKRRVPVIADRNWRLPSTEVTGKLLSASLVSGHDDDNDSDLAIYSQTVVRLFSYVHQSHDIETTPFAIHKARRMHDWRKYERKSATYLPMSYDRYHQPFYTLLPTLICIKSLLISKIHKKIRIRVCVRVYVTYLGK